MATKLTPVKKDQQTDIATELKAMNEKLEKIMIHSEHMDWNLWSIMNMVKKIGQANGYSFDQTDDTME